MGTRDAIPKFPKDAKISNKKRLVDDLIDDDRVLSRGNQ
jgi:hypothetical protein